MASLPPLDTPLASTLPTLESLARQGHPRAACRLAAELERCAALPVAQHQHDRWLAERRQALELARVGENAAAARDFAAAFEAELARREGVLAEMERHCAGVPETPVTARLERWRTAARLGDPTAIRQYAGGRVFSWADIVENAAAIPDYRREAGPMLQALARDGDLEATLLLAAAHSPLRDDWRGLLAQVMGSDGARSLALYRRALAAASGVDAHRARTLVSDISQQIEQLEHALTPEELQRARQLELDFDTWAPVDPAPAAERPIGAFGSLPPAPPAAC